MSTSTRNETTYNEVVGRREDGTVVILDYTFVHSDSFHGATGTELVPVSQEQVDAALTEDGQDEYWEEIWREDVRMGHTGTTLGLREWVEEFHDASDDEDEYLDGVFEPYDKLDHDEISDALGLVGDARPARWSMSGCGRIFPRALDGLINANGERSRELVGIILRAEEGNPV